MLLVNLWYDLSYLYSPTNDVLGRSSMKEDFPALSISPLRLLSTALLIALLHTTVSDTHHARSRIVAPLYT
jgi:hypothetical protein